MNKQFKVTILGSSAAVSAHGRSQSGLVLSVGNKNFLIDCGEGTQNRLEKYKISTEKLEVIFISHLHADHYLGVFGLISTMGLRGRKKTLRIIAPIGLREIISVQLKYSRTILPFELIIQEVTDREVVFETEAIKVFSFPLSHRITTFGYRFEEAVGQRRLKMDLVPPYFSIDQLKQLKQGLDVEINKQSFKFKDLTQAPPLPRSFAYASDTRPFPELNDYLKDVDLLYHEATFDESLKERAHKTYHSTAKQAAIVAFQSNVKTLLIGHFSARYKELDILLNEAKTIFDQTILAQEGLNIEVEKRS